VLCDVQNETEGDTDVCFVLCRVRLRETQMFVVCCAE